VTSALAALLFLATPALHLGQTKTADRGLPCPAHAAVAGALRDLLPGLRVEGPGELAEGDLEVRLARDKSRWLLSLWHPGGKVALQRALALPARDCALLGRTAALVIDRYLEDVRWSGRPPRLLPLPGREALPPPPQPAPEALPPVPERPRPLTQDAPSTGKSASAQSAAGADQASQTALSGEGAGSKSAADKAAAEKAAAEKAATDRAALEGAANERTASPETREGIADSPSPMPLHLKLLAGPGLYWGLASDVRFALSAGALLQRGRLQFGLSLAGTGSSGQPVVTSGAPRGQTQVRTGLLALSAGACADGSLLQLCGGPAAGLRLSLGSLSGAPSVQPGSAALAQLALGGHGTAGLRLTERLELSLDLLALWTPGTARFDVAGASSRTLSVLDLTWALRLGWLAF
jgi:hypothetical protein